jgi:hypothetical protein
MPAPLLDAVERVPVNHGLALGVAAQVVAFEKANFEKPVFHFI